MMKGKCMHILCGNGKVKRAAMCIAFMCIQALEANVLPDGYTRLTYIESTFKQCIHTGYTPVFGDKIECDVKISNTHTGTYLVLFGKQDDINKNCYHFTICTDATQGIGYGDNSYYERGGEWFRSTCNYLQGYDGGYLVHVTMQTNVVEWVRHDGTMHGYVAAPIDSPAPTMNRELYIFGGNHQDNKWATNPINMRLYSFKITSQDGIVRCNFIPCYRKSDSVVGLYDTVRNVFKSNESTSSNGRPFKAGPLYGSLPWGFRKANYIQSTSSCQYIDTGYVHGTNDLIAMEYYAPKTWQINGYCYLFGSRAGGDDHKSPENWYFYIGGNGADYITYNHKESKSLTNPNSSIYDYNSDPIYLECQANTATWVCGDVTNSLTTASTFADWTEGKYPLYIFGGDFAGSVQYGNHSVMRLYSFKIYRDIDGEMVLVHDFIPCMSGSGAAGLYDRKGDRFHGNLRPGTEDFIVDLCESRLPDSYTKVDYIKSTSALQYIDTGYWHGTNDLVVMEYYAPKTWQINGYCYLFGSRHNETGGHSSAENWSFYIGGKGQNRVNYNHQGSSGNDNPSSDIYDYLEDPIRLECQASTAKWNCGGATKSFTSTSTFGDWVEGFYPLYIFGGNCGGHICNSYCTVMRLYSFKIYRDIGGNMALVRDFVPCKNENGKAGLYDMIGERFYGNARTGVEDFIAKSFRGMVMSIR